MSLYRYALRFIAVALLFSASLCHALPTVNATLERISSTTLKLSFTGTGTSTANTVTNYTLSGTGNLSGNPTSAVLDASGSFVTLTVASMAALTHGATVIVTVGAAAADSTGNLVATYTVDAIPASFSFTSTTNALTATAYESNAITVSGINTTLTAAASTSSHSSFKCASLPNGSTTWGTFAACSSVTVSNGDQLKLQLTTPSTYSTAVSGEVILAGVSASFSVTTMSAETAAPVPIPSNVTTATLTSLTAAISSPSASLYLSSNGVVVVPASFSSSITLLSNATANTAFSIQIGAVAQFIIGGSTVTVQSSGTEPLFAVLKTFKVDNYPSLQVLEISRGRATVTGQTGVVPLVSVQLGDTASPKQVVIVPENGTSASLDIKINSNASALVGIGSGGSVSFRKASATSTVATADTKTTVPTSRVVSLDSTGTIIGIYSGSLSSYAVDNLPSVNAQLSRTGNTTLVLTFSRQATPDANTAAYYTLSGTGGISGRPTSAVLDASGTYVTLTVPSMSSLLHGATVLVTVDAAVANSTGNLVATYTVDAIPASFSFTSTTNALTATAYESNAITVSGINTTLTAAASTSSHSSFKCASLPNGSTTWGAFAACSSVTVSNGDQLKLQLTTPSTYSTAVSGEVVLAGVSASFSVTTMSAETAAPVPIPSNVTTATLTSLTAAISSPSSSLYLSSNGIVVVPASFSSSITLLSNATANTAFSIQIGAVAQFIIGGSTVTVQPSGTESLFAVLKTFKIDNYPSLQVLEISRGRATVTGQTGVAPLVSVQLGNGTTGKQVVILPTGGTATVDAKINDDTSALVGVTSGTIALRVASTTSTIATTDSATQYYANEVVTLNTSGAATGIRIGSADNNGTVVGDPMTFTSNSILVSDIDRQAKIPRLGSTLARLGSTDTLQEALFDTIGLRSHLARGGQTSQGVIPLLIDNIRYYFLPFGNITVDTSRSNGVNLTTDGIFEISRNGVMARFRSSLSDTQNFTTYMLSAFGASTSLNTNGLIEISENGNTLVAMPEMRTQTIAGATDGVAYGDDGILTYTRNTEVQRLLPVFHDMAQIATTFAALADAISVEDNLNGTVTATFTTGGEASTYTLIPAYRVLSPITVPLAHQNDAWWAGDDGLIYIKYSNGSAQGFSIR